MRIRYLIRDRHTKKVVATVIITDGRVASVIQKLPDITNINPGMHATEAMQRLFAHNSMATEVVTDRVPESDDPYEQAKFDREDAQQNAAQNAKYAAQDEEDWRADQVK